MFFCALFYLLMCHMKIFNKLSSKNDFACHKGDPMIVGVDFAGALAYINDIFSLYYGNIIKYCTDIKY